MTPFEQMKGHADRGEAYTISIILSNGFTYGDLELLADHGHWIQVRPDNLDMARPFWLRVQDMSMVEITVR